MGCMSSKIKEPLNNSEVTYYINDENFSKICTDQNSPYYRDRKLARDILKRLGPIPSNQLSQRQLAAIHCAKDIVQDPGPSRKTNSVQTLIMAKKLKNQNVNKDEKLTMAIIDQNHPEGAISPENWKLVDSRLLTVFLDVVKSNPGAPPRCHDAGWQQGRVKLIKCEDERSVELLKLAISKVGKPWPNAVLVALPKDQVPNISRAVAYLPAEPSNPGLIKDIIKASNPDLKTSDVRIVKVGDVRGKTRCVILSINEDVAEEIQKRKDTIHYGFGTVSLRFTDTAECPNSNSDQYLRENYATDADSAVSFQSTNDKAVGNVYIHQWR